ncbi:hypothetical protein [Rhodococcus zopfii]|uniref:hypothetical protein n=1 Tax=Rhodococcus zopfii TaxID=43772 RepID=UPI0011112379|nr:hypothetical protein [Rhodococcus zopfii]
MTRNETRCLALLTPIGSRFRLSGVAGFSSAPQRITQRVGKPHVRQGGWRLGALVACSVEKGTGNGRPPKSAATAALSGKVSAREFAEVAGVGKNSRALTAKRGRSPGHRRLTPKIVGGTGVLTALPHSQDFSLPGLSRIDGTCTHASFNGRENPFAAKRFRRENPFAARLLGEESGAATSTIFRRGRFEQGRAFRP